MYGARLRICLLPAALILACATGPAFALRIQPDYGAFQGGDLRVLQEAVKEWSDRLPCCDGKVVPITFSCNDNLDKLGWADVVFDPNGDVVSAAVTLRNKDLYFTLTEPADWEVKYWDLCDALTVAKHEIGHAIGFLHEGKFMNKVEKVDGNRFYDMNTDGVYNGNDFDLSDAADDEWEGHAASNVYLMYAGFKPQERKHESPEEARVLADAYGYCIPEPGTWLGLLCGCVGIIRLRRRPRTGS